MERKTEYPKPLPYWHFRHTILRPIDTVKLGYNEHSVVTNRFIDQIGYFSTQINPVITNPGYNEQKWPVPSCLTVFT